jgi:xanthosine phosphorylase
VHLYEGGPKQQPAHLVRTIRAIGVRALVLTNAAGSLRPEVGPGMPCLITDHINFQGTNPLVGPNDDAVGPRFPDLTGLYDAELRAIIRQTGDELGIDIAEGVYMAFLGPCFETPAEIRMAKILGADLVGMSTVPEAIAARHCGLKVVAISAVTNLAAGMTGQPLSHEETLREGAAAGDRIVALLERAMRKLADALD